VFLLDRAAPGIGGRNQWPIPEARALGLDKLAALWHKPCPSPGSFTIVRVGQARCIAGADRAPLGRRMGIMRRTVRMAWTSLAAAILCGCATGPLLDNPLPFRPSAPAVVIDNPVWIPPGPQAYNQVFEKLLDILDDYFAIAVENRYDGRIETFPAIAPGLEQPWKPGSPDFDQRLEATLQTIRHRAVVLIRTAEDGGYFIEVVVYKELEDLPKPTRATAGAASFRDDQTVERQFQVIDPTVFESNWIPVGRNTAMEQVILERIKKCM
jgi:hypothetical protein